MFFFCQFYEGEQLGDFLFTSLDMVAILSEICSSSPTYLIIHFSTEQKNQ